MKKHYTVYWVQEEFRRIESSGQTIIKYAYGAQLKKVNPGDTIWIITFLKDRGLLLIGKLVCGRRLSRAEATREIGEQPWSEWVVEAQLGTPEMYRAISIHHIISQLRFVSKHDRLMLKGRVFDPQQLRTIRELTIESAELLNSLWEQDLSTNSHEGQLRQIIGSGFGDPQTNQQVERDAVEAVSSHYLSKGWIIKSVEAERVGYDLHCIKAGRELHIEVKGITGKEVIFILTAGERRRAEDDPSFVLCAVTEALSAPKINKISRTRLNSSYLFEPIAYRVTSVNST